MTDQKKWLAGCNNNSYNTKAIARGTVSQRLLAFHRFSDAPDTSLLALIAQPRTQTITNLEFANKLSDSLECRIFQNFYVIDIYGRFMSVTNGHRTICTKAGEELFQAMEIKLSHLP